MAEYISVEKLIELKNNVKHMHYDLYDLEDFLADVKKECSADVVEVVHGEWLTVEYNDGSAFKECSNCGARKQQRYYNFCPNCGAKMDGERRSDDES